MSSSSASSSSSSSGSSSGPSGSHFSALVAYLVAYSTASMSGFKSLSPACSRMQQSDDAQLSTSSRAEVSGNSNRHAGSTRSCGSRRHDAVEAGRRGCEVVCDVVVSNLNFAIALRPMSFAIRSRLLKMAISYRRLTNHASRSARLSVRMACFHFIRRIATSPHSTK